MGYRLEDLEAIRNLKFAYARAADQGNADAMVADFADDAVFEIPGQTEISGKDEIRAYLAESGSLNGAPSRHLMTNPLIEFEGEDLAIGQWYLMAVMMGYGGEGRPAPVLAGKYDDHYVRVDGQWKFQRMRVEIEWQSGDP